MARLMRRRPSRRQSTSRFDYPKPDGVLTVDRLSLVFLSNTIEALRETAMVATLDMSDQVGAAVSFAEQSLASS